MRILILCLLVILFPLAVCADWYVIDETTNRAVSKTMYEPDQSDLISRGEFAVESDANISLHMAEYRNGDIKERLKTQEEKNKEDTIKAEKEKKDADFNSAKDKLMALGLTSDEVDSLR